MRLPNAVRDGFDAGLANAVSWPAMHGFPTIAEIGDAPWGDYEMANRAFAEAALRAVSDHDLIWVHDYHLMTVPAILRVQHPALRIGCFNHIPWPDCLTSEWRRPGCSAV